MADSLRRAPAWAWLAGIVICSIALRSWLGSRMPAPFIFTDELQYSENARSIANGEGIRVRGEPFGIVSILYPLVLAPAYALFDALPDAYAAARTLNAIVMSLAAIPAYLLGRRVLAPGLALVGALLAVAVPSMAYTGTLMSENAFYPAFLLAAWALVRALERPTLARHAVLLGASGVAVLVRVQAVAIVLAALTAPLLIRAVARVPLRPFMPLYAIVGAGAALVLGAQLARGSSLSTLLGAYQVVGEEGYEPVEVLRYLFWHVAELDLYVGVVPFAAFLLLAGRMRSLDGPLQAFLAAGVALSVWTLLVVSAFASRFAFAIEERNMFVLAPLLLLALLAWIERGLPRPRLLAGVVAGTAAALPALIPIERFLQLKVRSDTLMIVPLWNLQDEITLPRVDDVLLVAGVAAALAFLLVPRRLAAAFPAAILAYFALATQPIQAGPHGMERAAAGALFEAVRQQERDWIDEAVGSDAEVAALWTGRTHRFTVNMLEFFNRSVREVYTLGGPMPGGLPETVVTVDEETGEIVRPDGSVVRAAYAYTDGSVALDGQPIDADPGLGLTLYYVGGPLVSTTSVDGVDNDLWSGPEAHYRRVRCRGGTLVVTIGSDPGLHKRRQTVAAFGTRGNPRASVSFRPQETATLRVPLVPVDDVCEVDFRITPTAVPAGSDKRELGARFLSFEYLAP